MKLEMVGGTWTPCHLLRLSLSLSLSQVPNTMEEISGCGRAQAPVPVRQQRKSPPPTRKWPRSRLCGFRSTRRLCPPPPSSCQEQVKKSKSQSLESLESPIGLEPDGAENTALSKLSKLSKLPKLSKLDLESSRVGPFRPFPRAG